MQDAAEWMEKDVEFYPSAAAECAGYRPCLRCGQPTLIDDEIWTAVRNQFAANASDHRRKAKAAEPSMLAGFLVDARGSGSRHHTPSTKADATATTSPPP